MKPKKKNYLRIKKEADEIFNFKSNNYDPKKYTTGNVYTKTFFPSEIFLYSVKSECICKR